jgi:hypothetical protein
MAADKNPSAAIAGNCLSMSSPGRDRSPCPRAPRSAWRLIPFVTGLLCCLRNTDHNRRLS